MALLRSVKLTHMQRVTFGLGTNIGLASQSGLLTGLMKPAYSSLLTLASIAWFFWE